jgi:tRNA (guanine37-N1)-methyltransferase
VSLVIDVITLFPSAFPGPLGLSIPGRALERGLASLRAHDLREWGLGRHRSVDDYPYGGGAGMVLRPEPIAAALDAVAPPGTAARRILLDPGGRRFDQALAHELASADHLVLVCPRYEGVDDRVRALVDLELSIGDYVLSGGEPAALVVIDTVLRLLPGAIDDLSAADESFSHGLLEYPQYTRPPEFRGVRVPGILVSGNHGEVERWRRDAAYARTLRERPDLVTAAIRAAHAPVPPRSSRRRGHRDVEDADAPVMLPVEGEGPASPADDGAAHKG